jgi:hypothetical protein
MAWTDPVSRAVGFLVTAAVWNTEHVANLLQLKNHAHGGTEGEGSQELGPLTLADFTTAAAPSAPGAGKGRFHVVTGDRPGFRSGAAGAAEQLATLAGTETLANKTLTTPTIASFANAQHDHSDPAGGGGVPGIARSVVKTADEIVNNSSTLQADNALVLALEANSTYLVTAEVSVTIQAASDFQYLWGRPTGATYSLWHFVSGPLGGAGAENSQTGEVTEGVGATITNASGSARTVVIRYSGYVILAGTAGSITYLWAQNSAQSEDTTVHAGTVLKATKV